MKTLHTAIRYTVSLWSILCTSCMTWALIAVSLGNAGLSLPTASYLSVPLIWLVISPLTTVLVRGCDEEDD